MKLTTIGKSLVGSEEERAVSPVIGVILMVAITVILAAVIAAFVMDIGPGGESVTAGVDVSEEGTDVTVQATDLGSADGVILTDGNGVVREDKAVTTTGTSETFNLGSAAGHGYVGGPSYEYIVYAYSGEVDSSTVGNSLEDEVESVAVLDDGEVS